MAMVGTLLLKLMKTYLAKLATMEVAHWVLMELAEAVVKSTKNTMDDRWLAKFKEVVKSDHCE